MQVSKSLFVLCIFGLLAFPLMGRGLGARTSWPTVTLRPVT